MSTSLSAPVPKRHNAEFPRTPTSAANSHRQGQAQQPFRTSSPSGLNPYAQRAPGQDSPSSSTSSPQATMSMANRYTSSPSLSATSPLLSSSPTMAGASFDRISASDRDLKRYIDVEESQTDIEKRRADNRKTIQPHTFQKEYQQHRYGSSGQQDSYGTRDRLTSSPSQSYTSSTFADSSPNASFRTATSPNLGSPTSPQRSPAPVNYGHSAERLELEPLLRSVGGDQDRALRKVLDERNSLAFQNAQLWKLIERERQKNADLRVERGDARRQMMTEDSLASSPKIPGPQNASYNRSISSSQSSNRPLIIHEDEKENDNQKHVERLRANTMIEVQEQTARPAHPARYYSDQLQPRLPGALPPASQADGMTIEQNPFMLKMSNPLPFTSTQPSSPTKYVQPESGGTRPRFNSSPLIGTNSNPTSPRLPGFAENSDNMKTPTSATNSRPVARVLTSTSSLLPSPPIGSTPPLGDRTFSERTESSLATPFSEEMPNVPPPSDTTSHYVTRGPKGAPAGGRPEFLSTNSDTPSAESPSTENVPLFHRGVPQLTTGLLQHTRCTIPSSRVMPNAAGKEVLCFIVKVMLRPPGSQQVLSWNVSKMLSAFANLDNKIRTLLGSKKEIKQAGIGFLPESKTWKDFAPSKIDQRKAMLELYLQSLLATPMEKKEDLCGFLTSDVVAGIPSEIIIAGDRPAKSGYLTKRGKNLGGWKTRYFTLEGSLLHYCDKRGGNHLGTISILGAEIGRQHKDLSAGPQDDKAYRHALLIIEPKRLGAATGLKHVLCAESDEERDAWVAVLLLASNKQTEAPSRPGVPPGPDKPAVSPLLRKSTSSSVVDETKKEESEVQKSKGPKSAVDTGTAAFRPIPPKLPGNSTQNGFPSSASSNELSRSLPTAMDEQTMKRLEGRSAGNLVKGSTPARLTVVSPIKMKRQSAMPLRYQALTQERDTPQAPLSKINSTLSSRGGEAEAAGRITRDMISAPSNGTLLPAGFKFGKETNDRERKAKSIRIWGFGGKGSTTPASALTQVFGVPLQQALLVKSVANLPTPVFRCIKYLEAHHAEKEEGIYRIGGSQAVMNRLKERFNAEGDIDLLANDEHWDIHAIAGLLKWYFRDLPISVLDEQQTAFVQTMGMLFTGCLGDMWLIPTPYALDLVDERQRIQELGRLVSLLPVENYSLLRALCSHLILIIRHADENKMTLKNVAIILAPTIGVNGGTLSSFLLHFKAIFDGEDLLEPAPDALPHPSSQNDVHARDQQPSAEQSVIDDPPRNRNSRIYAESSEQMLGMGNRELDNQDEESETDYAGTEDSGGTSDADATAKDIGMKEETAALKSDTLTASSSMNDWTGGNGNIPRSPRMDWSDATSD
ncbi:hypothetical protein QFC21_003688 [Naganishia friedmannii]|uniref:Uncharacterized protein n=1 Tax=Naganishia friedmannii TaxID=89922 RepID=A0ACC2VMJ1_9TREE|nr:hypothetical protein QFC21_003688 [Naganishia friedmannii]